MNILSILSLLSLLLTACAPAPRYQQPASVKQLTPQHKQADTRVQASVEAWHNSGVIVEAGKKYQITATGNWRTYSTCNFTEADGTGLYKAWCDNSPLFPPLISGYSHSLLVGRIGESGSLISIGKNRTLTVETTGTLYFRINDCINCNHDNEGFVNVSIELIPEQAAAPAPKISSPTPPSPINNEAFTSLSPKQSRYALVIGNSGYLNSPLKNPVNDAKAMSGLLQNLGFEVIMTLDSELQAMESAIDQFARKIVSGNHVALFYYAGHGVQVDGENYLIPLNANINRQSDVRYKAVNVGQILGSMSEAEDNLNIVILDACRDNPLPRSFRSSSRGLAKVAGPKGAIIGFATSPGSVASDGEGDNGVYTKHLLQNMSVPGLSIEQVFKKVLQGVNKETNGQQTPWTESSFTGDFSFSN